MKRFTHTGRVTPYPRPAGLPGSQTLPPAMTGRALGTGLFFSVLLSATPALSHDIYTGLKNQRGQDCCGGRDCKVVGVCILPDHHEGVMIGDLCMPIPDEALIKEPSPDGNSHACIVAGQLRCVWLGAGV